MLSDLFGIDKFFACINQEPPSAEAIRQQCLKRRKELVDISFWEEFRNKYKNLRFPLRDAVTTSFDEDVVRATAEWKGESEATLFREMLLELRPWRKGPFDLFGTVIDCEWQSNLKWDRIKPFLPDLKNKVVADIGCNNGYYLFRMLPEKPRALLGLDPNGRFYHQFKLLHQVLHPDNVFFEPLGVEDAPLFSNLFDVVFCLGVIYHRKDPVQMLSDVKSAMKPGGTAFIESITIPGRDGECLVPKDRYAMMRNVWFVPTPETLVTWCERAGFLDVSIVDTTLTTSNEQRKTEFAHFDSLADFLDPADISRTVEGYPAPWRTIITAIAP